MEKKLRRPIEEPKSNRKSYRLSDADMDKLRYCKRKMGLSETDVIRQGIEKMYREAVDGVDD